MRALPVGRLIGLNQPNPWTNDAQLTKVLRCSFVFPFGEYLGKLTIIPYLVGQWLTVGVYFSKKQTHTHIHSPHPNVEKSSVINGNRFSSYNRLWDCHAPPYITHLNIWFWLQFNR